MKTFLPAIFLSLAIILNCPLTTLADGPKSACSVRQYFRATLYTNTGNVADGNVVSFDEMFDNSIDGNDAYKMLNPGENFGIMRDAQLLAIEARSPLQLTDTIFYNLENLDQQGYQFRFIPTNMESTGLTAAYLVDRHLQTKTFINLSDISTINLSITTDPGSAAADRFYVIFCKGRLTELNFIELSAAWNIDKAIDLNWKVDNERDIDHYTVERSNNGVDFTAIGTKNPSGNTGGTETYDTKDANANKGGHYYRISANDHYGQVKYSAVVNSGILEDATVSIYPNPVKDRTMNVHFINLSPGKYKLQLSNKMGQVVYATSVDVTGTNYVRTIKLDHVITIGTYQLSIIPATGNRIARQVMIE
jgi:hypothetical protein